MTPLVSLRQTQIEVSAGDTFIRNVNENLYMGDDENESERPRKVNIGGLNYFGLFLLFSSSSIIFTPLLEFFPNLAPNGWEALIWLVWGYAIFTFSIILLIVNNVFRFLENQRADRSTSHPTRNWRKNLKTLGTSLLLWFALIIILSTLPVQIQSDGVYFSSIWGPVVAIGEHKRTQPYDCSGVHLTLVRRKPEPHFTIQSNQWCAFIA